jgi:hypothetical protein
MKILAWIMDFALACAMVSLGLIILTRPTVFLTATCAIGAAVATVLRLCGCGPGPGTGEPGEQPPADQAARRPRARTGSSR